VAEIAPGRRQQGPPVSVVLSGWSGGVWVDVSFGGGVCDGENHELGWSRATERGVLGGGAAPVVGRSGAVGEVRE
jgi:hypothetical protein